MALYWSPDDYTDVGYVQTGTEINWLTKVITVPQFFLTPLGGSSYALDTNAFRLALRDLEDSEEGQVFPPTHNHSTAVTLGGIQYARVLEILSPYTVTFEDTGYPYVVSLVGSNNNILEKTNLGAAQILANNSAGLINITEIQQASYEGQVVISSSTGTSGTGYPIGKLSNPSSNITDAKIIAAGRNIDNFYILGNYTFGSSDNITALRFVGDGSTMNIARTTVTFTQGCITSNSHWTECKISGYQGGESNYHRCVIDGLDNAHCFYEQCAILDGTARGYSIRQTTSVSSGHASYFKECYSDEGTAILDRNGARLNVTFDGWHGRLKIINQNHATSSGQVWIHMNGGTLTIDPTCTNGRITVTGTGTLVNQSQGTEVDSSGFLSEGFTQVKLNIESLRASHQGYGERWFVDPVNGNDLSPGVSSQSPFRTVNRAMESAFSGRGDVIYLLSPGSGTSTINERIVVDKEDVHIRAPGRGLQIQPSSPTRAITSSSHNGTTATFLLSSTEGLTIGNPITVSGVDINEYNGEFIVTSITKDVQFTVALITTTLANGIGGTLSKVPTISIIANNCSLNGLLVRSAVNSSDDGIMVNAKFSRLENLYVVGSDSGADPQSPVTTDICIHYRGGDYHKLFNSEIEKAGSDGVKFTDAPINGVGSPREVKIDGCNIYFNRGHGVNFTGTSSSSTRLNIISDSRIQHNSGYGIHIGANTQRNMIMGNNYIKDNRTYPSGEDDPTNEVYIDPAASDAMIDVRLDQLPNYFHGITHDVESIRQTHQGFGSRFYVDAVNGIDTHNGTTIESAVKTVTKAIELTQSGRGDVIYLLAPSSGSVPFAERIVLDKEDVHIRGPGRGVDIKPATSSATEPVIRITANNCSLSGFVVRTHASDTTSDAIVVRGKFSKMDKLYVVGPGQILPANQSRGIVYEGGDYHELHDCEVEKFGDSAVELDDKSDEHSNGSPREISVFGGNFYLNGEHAFCFHGKIGAALGSTSRILRILKGANIHDNLSVGIHSDANVLGVVIDDSVLIHDNNGGAAFPQVELNGTSYYKAEVERIEQSADVWNSTAASFNTAGTFGNKLNTASAGGVDYVALADAVRTELTPELTKIMLVENGLTSDQATMLTEVYRLYGLDPTKPLIVTGNSRQAGAILQQIATNTNQTVITRV